MASSQKRYSASASIQRGQFMRQNHIIETGGIVLTLPTPTVAMANRLYGPAFFSNATATPAVLYHADGFLDKSAAVVQGPDSVVIGPYETISVAVIQVGTAAYYAVEGGTRSANMSWTPTLTWTTGTPASAQTLAEYKIIDGTCFFTLDIYSADGNGATALTATLPVTPPVTSTYMPCSAVQVVGTTGSNPLAFIDMADTTATNRVLGFKALSTCTDASAVHIRVAGFYELTGWTAYTATETYGTATPTTTDVNRFKRIGNALLFSDYHVTTDGKNATLTSYTLPNHGMIPDRNIKYAIAGYLVVDGTASDPKPFIDALNNTAESRFLAHNAGSTWTDTKACSTAHAGIIELADWSSFTPTLTFGTADPASVTTALAGKYHVAEGICFFTMYTTSTDGNAASSLSITDLPVPAKYLANREIAVNGCQIVDTTWYTLAPYITAGDAAEAARKTITPGLFTTCTDAKTATFELSGWYFVG